MAHRKGAAKVAKLRLDSIRLDAGTQVRAHVDDATVAEYAEAMVRGDRFPPTVIFQINGEFIMVDGFHRFRAARRARLTHILAEVRQGSRKDALRFALGANHKHGLRRSNGDKRRAVEIALAEFGNQSDRLLGQLCGVSQTFVGNIRHQLSTVYSSTPRLGKDGKFRALPVRGINGSARPEVVGDSISDAGDGGAAFMELAEALASLEVLVERVVQEHPDNRGAVRAAISKVRTDLLNLEKRVAASEHCHSKTAR
jgi:ParB-like nuclease domain